MLRCSGQQCSRHAGRGEQVHQGQELASRREDPQQEAERRKIQKREIRRGRELSIARRRAGRGGAQQALLTAGMECLAPTHWSTHSRW